MQTKKSLLLFALLLTLASCSARWKKYESNWIVVACEVDGINFKEEIMMFNFEIEVRNMSCHPPTLNSETRADRLKETSDIRFFKKDGKDYMEILDHYYFTGIYEIRCMDEGCCTIQLQSDRIQMELDYNGDLPFGWTRDCPKARSPF